MASSTTNYNLIKPDYEDNADIKDLNDNFDTIDTAMNNKVDKEIGKGLSTNDYTTAEKTKLDNLAEIKTVGTGLNLDDNGELTATGGGSGSTTNYNDLSNKPQINGNTLSGNKTSAQLGLASASDIPTTLADLSGDSTHRTVSDTEKAAWNNKSDFSGSYNDLTNKPTIPDELSDLTEDATHRTVTDTEKSTWNGKQSALSSAQLAAVNSGIDSAKVEQIETNKNNILTLESMNGAKNCAKGYLSAVKATNPTYSNWNDNVLSLNNTTFTFNSDYTVTINGTTTDITTLLIPCDVVSGVQYHMSGCPLNGSNDSYLGRITNSAGTTLYSAYDYGTGNNFTADTTTIYYQMRLANGYTASNIVFKPMIITKAAYDAGYTNYQPYAMTNAEITAWILSQS